MNKAQIKILKIQHIANYVRRTLNEVKLTCPRPIKHDENKNKLVTWHDEKIKTVKGEI